MVMRIFSFSPGDVATAPPWPRDELRRACGAAFVWRARPRALEIPAGEDEQTDVGERVEHGEAATDVRCGGGGPPSATGAE
uniref:Uncharacterized protein n=1 Tax=Oryza glaberrima TaxID=4538 RepID=I1QQC3_ORYGL